MQAHTDGASYRHVLSSSGTFRLWVVFGLLGVVFIVGTGYAVYDYLHAISELDKLLLQECDTEFIALKLNQERSNYRFVMVAIVFLIALSLCMYYFAFTNEEEDRWKAEEMRQKQTFYKMYHCSHNLKRELYESDAEKRMKTSQYEADKKSLQRRHKQELLSAEKCYQSQKEDYDNKIADLHRQINELQLRCEDLEKQSQREKKTIEKLKLKLKQAQDKLSRQSDDYNHEKQDWEEKMKNQEAQLSNALRQLNSKKQKESSTQLEKHDMDFPTGKPQKESRPNPQLSAESQKWYHQACSIT